LQTETTETIKRINLVRKWSPLCLALALVILAISAWYGPLSLSYLIRALMIGSGFSVLTIAYGRWKVEFPSWLIWSTLSVVLIFGGFYWSKDQTFGLNNVDGFFWSLAGQFISTVSAVFFAVVSALKRKLILA
jgi:hypothetical protein